MLIESLCRNWPLLHSFPFSPLLCTWLSLKSPFATLPLENLDEVQRCSKLLHRDGFRHHIRWIFLMLIIIKSITLSSMTHWRILWYLTSMCFICLWYMWFLARWIALWLSQWTRTESYMILNISTNPLNHKASFDALTATIYSASIIGRKIVSCNSAFQLMTHSATWTHSSS